MCSRRNCAPVNHSVRIPHVTSSYHMSHHHTTRHIIIPQVTSSYHMSHHHTTCHIIKLCHVIKIHPYDRAETLHTAYAAPHHRTVSNHHMCHIIILCHHMCHIIILCHLVGKDDSTIVDNSLKALAARCLVVGVLRLVVPLCVCARVTSSYDVTSSTTNTNVSWL